MVAAIFCGIDLGSTNIKVLLLEETGHVLARATRPTPRIVEEGGVSTDAEALLRLVETMMIEAHQAAAAPAPIAAVSIGGTGEEGVPIDRAVRALDRVIPWFDQRAASIAGEMAARSPWAGAPLPVALDYSRTAAKWAWARRYRPRPLEQAESWVALTDYPAARWTGRSFMSESLAARTACWHVGRRCWMTPLLSDCGAPPLPPVVSGGTLLGSLHSPTLRAAGVADAGTLVVSGGHDHPMAAFAVRQWHPDAIIDSMGTAELIYAEMPTAEDAEGGQPPPHPYFAFSRPVWGEGRIACLGVTELSASLDPMMQDTGSLGDAFRVLMAGGPVSAGAVRARLAAITEGTRVRLSALEALGVPSGPLFVGGGWARSLSFLRLRASLLGRPIHRLEEMELSAYGAALLAARAVGLSPPLDLAQSTIEPDPTNQESS
jgi:xylulokinase